MTLVYYYTVWLNAIVCLVAGVVVVLRNRHHAVGPLFGTTMLLMTGWLVCFAQYFWPLEQPLALNWARATQVSVILNYPFLFHSVCALVDQVRRWRRWIAASYVVSAGFLWLLWHGQLIDGLRVVPYLHHYVRYNPVWYPWLCLHILLWQAIGFGILLVAARQVVGYKRTQFVYFMVAWFTEFLTTNSIILPLQYGLYIQPFGFFIFPFQAAFLAYTLAQARVADFNVVITRVLVYVVTILVVIALCLLFVGIATILVPGLLDSRQVIFMVLLTAVIAMVLAITLPRLLPRAERIMQARIFSRQHGYQGALSGLMREIGHLSSFDELLEKVVTTIHSQMQLLRVLLLIQDPLSGKYRLQTESGLPADETTDLLNLPEDAAIVRWLREHKDVLVLDELLRTESTAAMAGISEELNRLKVVVCVPMSHDNHLVGLLALGGKVSREMFYVSDLKVLETLATEAALAVRYRRMEEQAIRNNKLVALGTIAAGVAHEIRNPLASISTFIQLWPTHSDDPEFKNEFSKVVAQDVERITRVIQSMLSFARPGSVNVGDHAVAELIDEALTLVQPRLRGKHVDMNKQFSDRLTLRVDKQQILQVLLNILNNALDVLPEQGVIRITTGIQEAGDKNNPSGTRLAIIEISDNGPGIPAALRARLFDPFFTTKPEGTGLGLSISQKIVRDHNGFITVSSVEGLGTAFQVHLPLI